MIVLRKLLEPETLEVTHWAPGQKGETRRFFAFLKTGDSVTWFAPRCL